MKIHDSIASERAAQWNRNHLERRKEILCDYREGHKHELANYQRKYRERPKVRKRSREFAKKYRRVKRCKPLIKGTFEYQKKLARNAARYAEKTGKLPSKKSLGCSLAGSECSGPLTWDHWHGYDKMHYTDVICVCHRHNMLLNLWRKTMIYFNLDRIVRHSCICADYV